MTIAFEYANTNSLNCLALGNGADEPCTGVLERQDNDTWIQGEALDSPGEKHVFRRAGIATCGWCSDDSARCRQLRWVEDGTGVISSS
ncbi:MAG: hypothetical protein GY811_09865 [Myxococcales bacterium]|nr:hypothetical protein [Myxococcales bacterium]